MTPNEINRAIALHLGWKEGSCGWWQRPDLMDSLGIPNYSGDLNAMHEVEELIYHDEIEAEVYEEHLMQAVVKLYGYAGAYRLVNARATQRAEAFLRTVGKW